MSKDVFIHDTAILDEGAEIGQGTKVWHFTHIMSKAKIGSNCIISQNCFLANNVIIGNGVKIQNNVSVYTGVVCEDDVFLGPSMVFTNVINPRSFIERKTEFKTTLVKQGATIGANATILCGVTIGRYAMVGAGAVVTKDVPDYGLCVGNPAELVAYMSRSAQRLHFVNETAQCPETNETYILKEGKVTNTSREV